MRVAVIVPMLRISGGIGVALHYAQKMAEEGHDVDVLNLDGTPFDHWYPASKVNIINCIDPTRFADVARYEYDVAVATLWSTLHQIRSGIVRARKVAYLIQGDEENFYPASESKLRSAVRETYEGDELKIVVSPWLQRQLQRRYPNQTFHVITNGTDVAKFSVGEPFMPKGGKLRVLIEGAISSPAKRVRETLDLLRGIENIETWLVSPVKGELHGSYPDVSLFEVPYEAMPSIYKSCHVLVKNSQTEGFALPVLEMMAAGGVPIVNNYGAQEDYIQHRVNGVVLPEMTYENLLGGLNFVISNYDSLSKKAQKTAGELSWTDQHTKLMTLIQDHPSKAASPIRPEFMRPHWFNQEAQVVSLQSLGMSAVARTEAAGVRGWLARSSGGDIEGLSIEVGGSSHLLRASIGRQDVADHFGKAGIYGFELALFPEHHQDFRIRDSQGRILLERKFPEISELPVRFDLDDLAFTVEAYLDRSAIHYDFARDRGLQSVEISVKPGRSLLHNGYPVQGPIFSTDHGTVSGKIDDILSVMERRKV